MWDYDDGWGSGFFGVLGHIAQWITGLLIFLIWLAVVLLFVRFLIIATRAAKLYLRQNGQHDGILPTRGSPTTPAPSAAPTPAAADTTRTATTPTATTKPRTPKTPPA